MQTLQDSSNEEQPLVETLVNIKRPPVSPLSYFLKKLDDLLDYTGEDEIGTTLGYVIIDSLIDFKLHSTSEQEISFREIRTIYRSIESVITSASQDEKLYMEQVSILKNRVNNFLDTELNKETKFDSHLLRLAVTSISEQSSSYEDILRRKGLALLENTDLSGTSYRNNKNFNRRDYNSIKETFI